MHPKYRLMTGLSLVILLTALSAACTNDGEDKQKTTPEPQAESSITVTSTAFAEGDHIPQQYTCQGDDISPPLAWTDLPEQTASLALIMDDPDAPNGIWVHWVLYNIPADAQSLPEAITTESGLPDGTLNGKNSWKRTGYGGPCPPSGTHRYVFSLYALDSDLELEEGIDKNGLLKAMDGHVLAEGRLAGVYQKQ